MLFIWTLQLLELLDSYRKPVVRERCIVFHSSLDDPISSITAKPYQIRYEEPIKSSDLVIYMWVSDKERTEVKNKLVKCILFLGEE